MSYNENISKYFTIYLLCLKYFFTRFKHSNVCTGILYGKKLEYTIPGGKLTSSIEVYLKEKGKDLQPWKVIGDFNGDNIEDYAGVLRNNIGILQLIIVYSISNSKYSHVVKREDCGKDNQSINIGIYSEKPGIIYSFPFEELKKEDAKDTLLYTGVTIVHFEASSATYYWKNGEIKTIWTSD